MWRWNVDRSVGMEGTSCWSKYNWTEVLFVTYVAVTDQPRQVYTVNLHTLLGTAWTLAPRRPSGVILHSHASQSWSPAFTAGAELWNLASENDVEVIRLNLISYSLNYFHFIFLDDGRAYSLRFWRFGQSSGFQACYNDYKLQFEPVTTGSGSVQLKSSIIFLYHSIKILTYKESTKKGLSLTLRLGLKR